MLTWTTPFAPELGMMIVKTLSISGKESEIYTVVIGVVFGVVESLAQVHRILVAAFRHDGVDGEMQETRLVDPSFVETVQVNTTVIAQIIK